MISLRVPIPKIFHSLELGGPFQRCVLCEADLLVDGMIYGIDWYFKGDEPIIEYAMCAQCDEKTRNELSNTSLQRVHGSWEEHVDREKRVEMLRERISAVSVENWIDRCLFTGAEWSECRERKVCAICEAGWLILDEIYPYMASGAAIEQINDLLSEQTRGRMKDFMDEHFGMPPEFCDAPGLLTVLA